LWIGWRSWGGGGGAGIEGGRGGGGGEKKEVWVFGWWVVGGVDCVDWIGLDWIGSDWIGLGGGGKRKGEGMDENGAKSDKERNLGRRDRKAENATIDGGSEISG